MAEAECENRQAPHICPLRSPPRPPLLPPSYSFKKERIIKIPLLVDSESASYISVPTSVVDPKNDFFSDPAQTLDILSDRDPA